MIEPTVGRIVWVYGRPGRIVLGKQPEAAIITYVHDDRTVSACDFDARGRSHSVSGIPLQDDDIPQSPAWEREGMWAAWMPYQKGQAAKTEAAEAASTVERITQEYVRSLIDDNVALRKQILQMWESMRDLNVHPNLFPSEFKKQT